MKPYKIRRSKIDNLGLYATKDITSGSKIIEYKGKVITRKEAEENPKYDNDKAIYLFNLNKRYDLEGEEFSYDYGFSFDEDYKNYPCRCKSKNCCGYIVREGSRWRIKKKIKLNGKNKKL